MNEKHRVFIEILFTSSELKKQFNDKNPIQPFFENSPILSRII
jgi:hypothetical protein